MDLIPYSHFYQYLYGMEKLRKIKIAFGLLNIFKEGYWGNSLEIRTIVQFFLMVHNIYPESCEIEKAIDFIDTEIESSKTIKTRNKRKRINAVNIQKFDYNKRFNVIKEGIKSSEDYIISSFLKQSDVEFLINELKHQYNNDVILDKYVEYSDFKDLDIKVRERIQREEVEEHYLKCLQEEAEERRKEEEKEREENISEQLSASFDDDDEICTEDYMEIKRDAWGNLYTLGGQMWEESTKGNSDE